MLGTQGGGMAYRYGEDRNQMMLFPESIDQYVCPDHPVRAYDVFMDTLDFDQLCIELNDCNVGNSQYDPRLSASIMILRVSIDGTKFSRMHG